MNNSFKTIFKNDFFLTKIISKKCFIINKQNSFFKSVNGKNKIKKFLELNKSKKFFIHLKISEYDKLIDRFLQQNNFKLIERNEIYEKKNKFVVNIKKIKLLKIRLARSSDKNKISNIAQKNFKYSRFHKDKLISNYYANKIKKNWIENYFYGKRGDELIIAELDKKIVGFLLLINTKKCIFIDLICVDKKYSGRGIGKSMIEYLETNYDFISIKVGTQSNNLPSKKLYENSGFKINKTNYTYHYHN